jgi:hypothetical protein
MHHVRDGAVRAIIPFTIMTVIALMLHYGDSGPGEARSTFIVGLIVASVAGFSVIYDVERWSLTRQSAVHFGCMVVTVFPCLLLSGWFETGSMAAIFRILLIFLMVGVVLWGASYIIFGRLLSR